jgi:tRNA-2-methylthio-N6-dimethylallyladenosine synthase
VLENEIEKSPITNQKAATRKVFVETWGCQMNVADSEKMLGMLHGQGWQSTSSAESADLVLLNTCHIREKAKQKILSRLGVLKQIKASKPGMQIAVAGCVAQAEGSRLLKDAPQIDVLVGPGKLDDLPGLLQKSADSGKSAMAVGFRREHHDHDENHKDEEFKPGPTLTGKNEVTRFVTIIQGCNNYCTFCVVPFTRGREISRSADEILREVRGMITAGAREIMLLGQNVNSWGLDLIESGKMQAPSERDAFTDLLARVASEPGLSRLRFTTSNPHDFTPHLAKLFATEPRMGRYMHLPVQSGNDRVLEAMKRKVTVAEYLERVRWLREAAPDIAISTDLIVGFPGETEEEFEDTLKLVETVAFSFSYSFKYSPRKNTVAARMGEQVPEDVKDRRLAKLIALQDQLTTAQHEAEIGKQREVLFTYESKKEPGIWYGRTEHFRLVRVKAGRDLTGLTLPVDIKGGNKTALVGELSP